MISMCNFPKLTHREEDVLASRFAIRRLEVHVSLPSDGHRRHLQNDTLDNRLIL